MKKVYVCEGCGTDYPTMNLAEKCEKMHSIEMEKMHIISVKFEKHRPEIRAICVQYDRELVGVDHVERVWFYAK